MEFQRADGCKRRTMGCLKWVKNGHFLGLPRGFGIEQVFFCFLYFWWVFTCFWVHHVIHGMTRGSCGFLPMTLVI
jgi:hypothetical protein